MNVGTLLTRSAQCFPSAPAITWQDRTETYRELDARSNAIALHLRNLGLVHGDRVGLLMWNRPELIETIFAVLKAGCCIVPLNARFVAEDVAYHVHDSEMSALFTDRAHTEMVRSVAPETAIVVAEDDFENIASRALDAEPVAEEVAPSDLAWLFYTSGTTGRPKGAMLSHAALTFVVVSWLADLTPLDEHDVTLHAAPLTHGAGFHALAAVARAVHQVIPDSPSFAPRSILDLMRRQRVTNTWFVPTQVIMLTDHVGRHGAELPDLKYVVYGGAPFPPSELERAIEAFGSVFVQLYAQGETPMTATVLRREDHRNDHLASAGRARPGVELRIVDREDVPVGVGVVGEILVRGPSVMSGYWRRTRESEEALRGGWLHTGDLGRIDADGYLYVLDRLKDVIISGGANVYAVEVEQVLVGHPDVAEVAVVGVPDRVWGERVVAAVVAEADRRELDTATLDAYCKERLSAYKRPRSYVYVAELPRNAYGKVLKSRLRQELAAGEDP